MNIGDKIKNAREENGLTQTQAAAKGKVTQPYYENDPGTLIPLQLIQHILKAYPVRPRNLKFVRTQDAFFHKTGRLTD